MTEGIAILIIWAIIIIIVFMGGNEKCTKKPDNMLRK